MAIATRGENAGGKPFRSPGGWASCLGSLAMMPVNPPATGATLPLSTPPPLHRSLRHALAPGGLDKVITSRTHSAATSHHGTATSQTQSKAGVCAHTQAMGSVSTAQPLIPLRGQPTPGPPQLPAGQVWGASWIPRLPKLNRKRLRHKHQSS